MTTMIEIKIGDKVISKDNKEIGVIKDIKLVPNGVNNPELVAQLFIYIAKTDKMVCSTSENWKPLEDENYQEFYPSCRLGYFADIMLKEKPLETI